MASTFSEAFGGVVGAAGVAQAARATEPTSSRQAILKIQTLIISPKLNKMILKIVFNYKDEFEIRQEK
jgi:hypothetical protein